MCIIMFIFKYILINQMTIIVRVRVLANECHGGIIIIKHGQVFK